MSVALDILTDYLANELEKLPAGDKDAEDFCSADDERDAAARDVCREILRRLDVYDAGGCPLCLS